MNPAPKTNHPVPCGFINLPVITDWHNLNADAVIFGVPHGKPYQSTQFPNNQSSAPAALREASPRIVIDRDVIDTDKIGKNRLSEFRLVDGGDIPLLGEDVEQHYLAAEQAVRHAIAHGIMPVSIGGDDGVTNPVLRGFDAYADITVIQIDAHLDWRDERFGEKDGYSSPMRRASELPFVSAIHQIGIRSFGSAHQSDLEDAQSWGANIHHARTIHEKGMQPVIDALPAGGNFFVTLDVDGLDPSIMPGTIALSPGGLSWWDIDRLFTGLTNKGNVVGLNLVELAPKNDMNQISMIGAGRLILKLLMLQLSKASI